ncbi:SMODS-associated NUDIX domain-containing protein [Dyadobacter sediminis]|uniref:CD-NTase-associated protein 16 NUDIX domain-containing protein n=1 Tax=Dyadobacter sediminis TaxID=1493691 RepID=A0A5R9K5P6_9BACT|nr:HU-CCDC81 and SPOR domain-containing protein [Dyadobacter sediminis]TLU88981.1 hypothetical protein FEM55_23105 [Dyadobacter sediminis]GGC15900.1 hypothetical protein GCM10011325_48380 [Dyadobacter sediminis]
MKLFIEVLVSCILIGAGALSSQPFWESGFTQAGVITLLTFIITATVTNFKRLKLALHLTWLSIFNKRIRFSMSYLYLIKIDDKYLLVKNFNFGHYQLVGGKYKRFDRTQSILQNDFKAIDDLKLKNSGGMKDDFALFVPARKALKFIDWFNSGKDREISHWREFYEELIEGKSSVLSQKNFKYVNYYFKGTLTTPIHRTPGWNCNEILQYDILELIPTPEQECELRDLQKNGDTDYVKWADEDLIQCLGHCRRQKKLLYKIGAHTKWALNMKWDDN